MAIWNKSMGAMKKLVLVPYIPQMIHPDSKRVHLYQPVAALSALSNILILCLFRMDFYKLGEPILGILSYETESADMYQCIYYLVSYHVVSYVVAYHWPPYY